MSISQAAKSKSSPLGGVRPLGRDFFCSLLLHCLILSILIISFDRSSRLPVLKNSDKNDHIINAQVMDVPPTPKKIKQLNLSQPIAQPTLATQDPPVLPVIKSIVKPDTVIVPDRKKAEALKEAQIKKHLALLHKQKIKQRQIRQATLQKEFAKEMQQLNLEHQMQQEQQRIVNLRSEQVRGEVNKYKALILQAISQHWLVPPNVNKKLSSELLIRMAPGGMVLDVQLIKSSGDEALDRSARAAVFKASPLPVPIEHDAFEPFRQFVLKVKPQNVLTNDDWIS